MVNSPPPLPSDSPENAIQRRRRFFSWRNALIVLAVGIAGLVWWSRDEPPPDVSDLVFAPLQLPADQNAYAVLTKAAQLVPVHEKSDEREETIKSMTKGDDWNDSVAQTCLTDITPAWPLFCQAQLLPQGQTTWMTSYGDILPELVPIRKLANLAQIRARAQALSGQPDEALRTALVVLSAGHCVEESRGSLIHFLTGIAIKNSSLTTIHDIVANHDPSKETLLTILRAVSTSHSNKNSLTLAFNTELRLFDSALPFIKRDGLASVTNGGPNPWLKSAGHIPLLLKPNRTRRIFADFIRASSGEIDQPLAVLKSTDPLNNFDRKHVRGKFFFNPDNLLGRIILAIVTPATSAILKVRLRDQSQISATEAFLALTLYKREHGELPATLDALVPAYLPAVPRDYMDGAPIRYSRDLGVVWSVGQKNLSITHPDQVIAEREVVLYLTPRPRPPAEASPAF